MSTTYSIACKDCKKKLWIGQGSFESKAPWLYAGGNANEKLATFLVSHIGHPLIFDSDFNESFDEYEDE